MRFRLVALLAALGPLATDLAAQDMDAMQSDDAGDAGSMMGSPMPSPSRALTPDEIKFFESKIRPILIANCYGCHSTSSGKSRGGLKLDSRDATLAGGESGPAVVPHDVDSSLLVRAVRYDDPDTAMPPAGRLKDEEIRLLEQWVEMGAPDPRGEIAPAGMGKGAGDSPGTAHRWMVADVERARREHWSYRPVAAPVPPEVRDATWPAESASGAIDRFVLAELEKRGLTPAPDADRRTLLRRASLDLTGLPPSAAEIAAFESDSSPDAYAKAIDRLLASPRFGERWGRHWLDVARYAESSGKENNVVYPHAWRYRDYVIESFNEDKPFDRFLAEQLAGDLLESSSEAERAELLVATGYLAIGPKSHQTRGRPQFQMDLADEQLDAVTQGMLGLTVACARCHDHKFDPIRQSDYYALAGIFLSTETRYGTFESQGNSHPSRLVELPKAAEPVPGASMGPLGKSVLAATLERVSAEAARSEAIRTRARELRAKGEEIPSDLQAQLQRARIAEGANRNLESVRARFGEDGRPTDANLVAMGAVDREKPVTARILDRGEIDRPGDRVQRGFVALVSSDEVPRIREGSGRLELAEWIASEDHPLTARVWANRIWSKLFGRGIVPTPDNFGMSGQAPTHPELLDHLASRLVAEGWSTKALLREVMLSRAYRMSSAFDAADAAIDPDGTWLWRMPKKRLEAEAIRDSMLLAGGLLDLAPPAGSPINMLEGGFRSPAQDRLSNALLAAPSNHRSVYLPIVRDRIPESLEVFDFAEPSFVTGQRDATNVPTQALYLMNSEEILRLSDAFARRLAPAGDREIDRINAAFSIAFGRRPDSREVAACRSFLDDFRAAATADSGRRDGAIRVAEPEPPRRNGRRPSERMRQRIEQARSGSGAPIDLESASYAALCQALLLSAEFRTVD